MGDVTGVLRKKGRNVGPNHPNILVTNLAALPPSPVVCMYQKRWTIELRHGERQSDLGLGAPQGSGDTNRREQAIGIAVRASVLVMRVCHHASVPDKPWSMLQLQPALR